MAAEPLGEKPIDLRLPSFGTTILAGANHIEQGARPPTYAKERIFLRVRLHWADFLGWSDVGEGQACGKELWGKLEWSAHC